MAVTARWQIIGNFSCLAVCLNRAVRCSHSKSFAAMRFPSFQTALGWEHEPGDPPAGRKGQLPDMETRASKVRELVSASALHFAPCQTWARPFNSSKSDDSNSFLLSKKNKAGGRTEADSYPFWEELGLLEAALASHREKVLQPEWFVLKVKRPTWSASVITRRSLLSSDVVVQIVDARNPLLFRCPDLVREQIYGLLDLIDWNFLPVFTTNFYSLVRRNTSERSPVTRWTCCCWTRQICWRGSNGEPGPSIFRRKASERCSGPHWPRHSGWTLKKRWELESFPPKD